MRSNRYSASGTSPRHTRSTQLQPHGRWAALLLAAVAVACHSVGVSHAQEVAPRMSDEAAREMLDESLRLAGQTRHEDAVNTFMQVRESHPDAIQSIDGLKIAVVLAVMGDRAAHEEHSLWLAERYREPALATDADRAVKGYILLEGADNQDLLELAVELTTFAVERAEDVGEGEFMPWFEVSRGIAAYRTGGYDEAAAWSAKAIADESPYIRSLALVFNSMAEWQLGNLEQAGQRIEQARAVIDGLPRPGTPEYEQEWTDTLSSRMALAEADALFESDAGFVSIFDGNTLDGWSGIEGIWRVEDGHIIGESTEERPVDANTFLIWRGGEPELFELRFQYRIDSEWANSGVQVRSEDLGDHVVAGPQADIATDDWISGIHYEERGRGILARRGERTVIGPDGTRETERFADEDELGAVIRHDGWNTYHVIVRRNSIIARINGHKMHELEDHSPEARRSGVIAFQLHAGPPMRIRFKDIALKLLQP